jgi:hypothetical protein
VGRRFPKTLPYTRNSPYVALCLALYMGAKRVGLIGVDFVDHHFFIASGRHLLAGELNQINNEYTALASVCSQLGVEVFNLSAKSRLTAFREVSPEQFSRSSLVPAETVSVAGGSRVFFGNYRFLSCGEVVSDVSATRPLILIWNLLGHHGMTLRRYSAFGFSSNDLDRV